MGGKRGTCCMCFPARRKRKKSADAAQAPLFTSGRESLKKRSPVVDEHVTVQTNLIHKTPSDTIIDQESCIKEEKEPNLVLSEVDKNGDRKLSSKKSSSSSSSSSSTSSRSGSCSSVIEVSKPSRVLSNDTDEKKHEMVLPMSTKNGNDLTNQSNLLKCIPDQEQSGLEKSNALFTEDVGKPDVILLETSKPDVILEETQNLGKSPPEELKANETVMHVKEKKEMAGKTVEESPAVTIHRLSSNSSQSSFELVEAIKDSSSSSLSSNDSEEDNITQKNYQVENLDAKSIPLDTTDGAKADNVFIEEIKDANIHTASSISSTQTDDFHDASNYSDVYLSTESIPRKQFSPRLLKEETTITVTTVQEVTIVSTENPSQSVGPEIEKHPVKAENNEKSSSSSSDSDSFEYIDAVDENRMHQTVDNECKTVVKSFTEKDQVYDQDIASYVSEEKEAPLKKQSSPSLSSNSVSSISSNNDEYSTTLDVVDGNETQNQPQSIPDPQNPNIPSSTSNARIESHVLHSSCSSSESDIQDHKDNDSKTESDTTTSLIITSGNKNEHGNDQKKDVAEPSATGVTNNLTELELEKDYFENPETTLSNNTSDSYSSSSSDSCDESEFKEEESLEVSKEVTSKEGENKNSDLQEKTVEEVSETLKDDLLKDFKFSSSQANTQALLEEESQESPNKNTTELEKNTSAESVEASEDKNDDKKSLVVISINSSTSSSSSNSSCSDSDVEDGALAKEAQTLDHSHVGEDDEGDGAEKREFDFQHAQPASDFSGSTKTDKENDIAENEQTETKLMRSSSSSSSSSSDSSVSNHSYELASAEATRRNENESDREAERIDDTSKTLNPISSLTPAEETIKNEIKGSSEENAPCRIETHIKGNEDISTDGVLQNKRVSLSSTSSSVSFSDAEDINYRCSENRCDDKVEVIITPKDEPHEEERDIDFQNRKKEHHFEEQEAPVYVNIFKSSSSNEHIEKDGSSQKDQLPSHDNGDKKFNITNIETSSESGESCCSTGTSDSESDIGEGTNPSFKIPENKQSEGTDIENKQTVLFETCESQSLDKVEGPTMHQEIMQHSGESQCTEGMYDMNNEDIPSANVVVVAISSDSDSSSSCSESSSDSESNGEDLEQHLKKDFQKPETIFSKSTESDKFSTDSDRSFSNNKPDSPAQDAADDQFVSDVKDNKSLPVTRLNHDNNVTKADAVVVALPEQHSSSTSNSSSSDSEPEDVEVFEKLGENCDQNNSVDINKVEDEAFKTAKNNIPVQPDDSNLQGFEPEEQYSSSSSSENENEDTLPSKTNISETPAENPPVRKPSTSSSTSSSSESSEEDSGQKNEECLQTPISDDTVRLAAEPKKRENITFLSGWRKVVKLVDLLSARLLNEKTVEGLESGILGETEVAEELRKYLNGEEPIAGLLIMESGEKMSLHDASKKRVIRRGTAVSLLEAQAATGSIISPYTGEKMSVEEATKCGLIDKFLSSVLIRAERAACGFNTKISPSPLSLFEAMKKNLVVESHGIRLLEAQIATGGIIDPRANHRLPVEVAFERGLFDERLHKILEDPSDDTKGFFDPNTNQNLTYLQLIERCITDEETSLKLLPIYKGKQKKDYWKQNK